MSLPTQIIQGTCDLFHFSLLYSMVCFLCSGVLAQHVWDQSEVSAKCWVEFVDTPVPDRLRFSHSLDIASHHGCSPLLASFLPAPTETPEHLFLLSRHPGHLFLSRPHHKVYMITFLRVDQTCLLTNAAERDKRSSPGILGAVQEPREERLWAAPVRGHGQSVHGAGISETLYHSDRYSWAGSC